MNTPTPLQVTHHGITITYDEGYNTWVFELRGRERKVESLAKAKEAIDKPAPQKKKSTFDRIKCWEERSRGDWDQVEVTSIAAENYGRQVNQVWIVHGEDRSKSFISDLFPVNDHNNAIIAECTRLQAEIGRLNAKLAQEKGKLKCLELPKEEE